MQLRLHLLYSISPPPPPPPLMPMATTARRKHHTLDVQLSC
jgi:hypothetical protein